MSVDSLKVAIIADVHSNLQALEAVMHHATTIGADMVVCAGDIVGYGAHPKEAIRVVAERARHIAMGNHDFAAARRDTAFMNPYAAKAVLWTADILDETSRGFLERLGVSSSFQLGGMRFAMFHGSLDSYTEYIYEEDVHEGMLARSKCDVLILGHTHVPYVKKLRSGIALNPGSVGQPRDGDWRASFALLDTESRNCEVLRIEYNIDAAAEAIDAAGLPPFLADRLYDGR